MKRAALVRRSRLTRSGFRAATRTEERRRRYAELDDLCREAVFRRARHKCERCGKADRLQWAHVYSRRYLRLRWLVANSMCLCAGCHLWWHHHPLDAAAWHAAHYGPGVRVRLGLALAMRGGRIDLEAVRLGLEAELGQRRAAGA